MEQGVVPGFFRLENFGNETLSLERLEFVGFFASSDEEGGNAKFLLNGNRDAAFAGAIELSHDEAIKLCCFVEFFGLGKSVGARASTVSYTHLTLPTICSV